MAFKIFNNLDCCTCTGRSEPASAVTPGQGHRAFSLPQHGLASGLWGRLEGPGEELRSWRAVSQGSRY